MRWPGPSLIYDSVPPWISTRYRMSWSEDRLSRVLSSSRLWKPLDKFVAEWTVNIFQISELLVRRTSWFFATVVTKSPVRSEPVFTEWAGAFGLDYCSSLWFWWTASASLLSIDNLATGCKTDGLSWLLFRSGFWCFWLRRASLRIGWDRQAILPLMGLWDPLRTNGRWNLSWS